MRAGVQTGDRIIKVGTLDVLKRINCCWKGTEMPQWCSSLYQHFAKTYLPETFELLYIFLYLELAVSEGCLLPDACVFHGKHSGFITLLFKLMYIIQGFNFMSAKRP